MAIATSHKDFGGAVAAKVIYRSHLVFTGIVQGIATIDTVTDNQGIRTFAIEFPAGFCQELEIGASISIDGVCLTVTEILSDTRVTFDVIVQSLNVTTLGSYVPGSTVNVERAAKDGAEIGGHPLSGHIDFNAGISEVEQQQDNFRVRIAVEKEWLRYIFPKGYIALNGASLTIATVDKKAGWFEVWLIPETRRMTTIGEKCVGDKLNVEIERGTQVVVDTIRDALEENLGALTPLFEKLLEEQGVDVNALGTRRVGDST